MYYAVIVLKLQSFSIQFRIIIVGTDSCEQVKAEILVGSFADDIAESIATVKSRSDISQRFYFSMDNSITVDEAYRFRQNKWIEKQLQQKERTVKQPLLSTTVPVTEKKSGKQKVLQQKPVEQ